MSDNGNLWIVSKTLWHARGGGGEGGAAIVCHPIQMDKKTSAHFVLRNRDNFWHLRQSHILKFHSKQTLPAD